MGSKEYGNFGKNLGNASKTALYEEGLRDPGIENLFNKIQNVLSATSENPQGSTSEASVTVQERDGSDFATDVMKKQLKAMGVNVPQDRRTPDEIITYAQENIKEVPPDKIKKTLKTLQDRVQREDRNQIVQEVDRLYRERSRNNRQQENAVRSYMEVIPNYRQGFVRNEVGRSPKGRDRRHQNSEKQARQEEVEKSREQKVERQRRRNSFHTQKSTDGGKQEKVRSRRYSR